MQGVCEGWCETWEVWGSQNTRVVLLNKEFHGHGPSCVYRDNKCTVWCQCGNCTHNFSRGTEDAVDLREVCPKGAQRRSERKTLSWQQGDCQAINSDPAVIDALVTCDESWIYGYDSEIKRHSSQWKHAGSPRPNKAWQSKSTHKFWWSLFWQHWHDLQALGIHWTDSQQGILCWVFKGVQKEILSEEASTLQIESMAFPPG